MATVELTVTKIDSDGDAISYTNASTGADNNDFDNNGKTFIIVHNAGASSATATFTTVESRDGNAVADKAITVAAGATKIIGPFDRQIYNDSNGQVTVTAGGDGAADLDYAVFTL